VTGHFKTPITPKIKIFKLLSTDNREQFQNRLKGKTMEKKVETIEQEW